MPHFISKVLTDDLLPMDFLRLHPSVGGSHTTLLMTFIFINQSQTPDQMIALAHTINVGTKLTTLLFFPTPSFIRMHAKKDDVQS